MIGLVMRTILLTLCFILSAVSAHDAHAGYDKPYIGDMIEHKAAYEDTFVHLARKYGLGYVEMRAANPEVDPWVPGAGARLTLPTRHILPDAPKNGIVINLPEMRLYAFVNGDNAPETFPIGVGREGLDTPTGTTKVVRKKDGPTWRPTLRMRKEDPSLPQSIPPGPENPLGTHALYLGWPTYALHGTNRPFGIGRRISSGCIRLYPENITELYNMIPVGTKVTVVNQPLKFAWIDDYLYLEAHPTMKQAIEMEETGRIEFHTMTKAEEKKIIRAAGDFASRLRWPAIRTILKERRGYPVAIARRPRYIPQNINEIKTPKTPMSRIDEIQMSTPEKQTMRKKCPLKRSIKIKPIITNKTAG
jgi:L,D-transpeptidase ErfK/SrfK